MSDARERAIIEARVRENQWKYWAPLAIAPIPYACVSLYRNAKTPQAKQLLLGVGVIGIPIISYAGRVFLMSGGASTSDQKKQPMSLAERSKLVDRL